MPQFLFELTNCSILKGGIFMDIKEEIKNLNEELINLRRDFHMNPELGFEEYRTSEIIAKYLNECDLEVYRNVAKTGVVGILKGYKSGPTLMLRSDMDALPISEENDLSYKSQNEGVMHACGHDGHVAMLLVAAKILSKYKDQINGNIKFVFQPNEEDAGAEAMIADGVMDNPKVDAALGIHLWSPIKSGKLGITSGPLMASSYYFKLVIYGKGGHGGAPHIAIDPISCGIDIMKATETMQTKELDALHPTIITFCKINAGTSPIIIPEKVEIEGSLRCLHENTEKVQERFKEIVDGISKIYRTRYELEFKCGNTLLSNDPKMTEMVRSVGTQVVGEENILDKDISVMIGEDFAEFGLRVPSTFYFVGVANDEKETNYPHHHSRFNIDEDVLQIGVEMHVRGALEYFKRFK